MAKPSWRETVARTVINVARRFTPVDDTPTQDRWGRTFTVHEGNFVAHDTTKQWEVPLESFLERATPKRWDHGSDWTIRHR